MKSAFVVVAIVIVNTREHKTPQTQVGWQTGRKAKHLRLRYCYCEYNLNFIKEAENKVEYVGHFTNGKKIENIGKKSPLYTPFKGAHFSICLPANFRTNLNKTLGKVGCDFSKFFNDFFAFLDL